jgi:hypothetical protein
VASDQAVAPERFEFVEEEDRAEALLTVADGEWVAAIATEPGAHGVPNTTVVAPDGLSVIRHGSLTSAVNFTTAR